MKRKAHGAREPTHILKYVEIASTAQRGDSPAPAINQRFLATRSKSLRVFTQKYSPACSIRFSEKNFGKSDNILALPYYAAFCV